jgi:hypothetical protein
MSHALNAAAQRRASKLTPPGNRADQQALVRIQQQALPRHRHRQ